MPFGAPETICRQQCPAHQVSTTKPQINGQEVSPAEYLASKNGQLKLDVPRVRGAHQVSMNGTVPAEWRLA